MGQGLGGKDLGQSDDDSGGGRQQQQRRSDSDSRDKGGEGDRASEAAAKG